MNDFRILKSTVILAILSLLQSSILAQGVKSENLFYRDSIRKYFPLDSAKTKGFIKDYISKSKRDNNPKDLFDGYHALASFYFKHNDTLKLIENTDKLFSVAKSNNLKIELLKGYHLKNNYLIMTSGLDDPRIFDNIYEAIQIAKEINNQVWLSKFNHDIAGYYKLTGDFKKAILFHKQNLSILKDITKSKDYERFKIWGSSLEEIYLELSDIHIELKEIDSAKFYNHSAKSVLDTSNGAYNDIYRFRNKIHELEINLLEDKTNLAKNNLDEAFKIIPNTLKKTFEYYSKYYYSGIISYHEGNFQEAIEYFEAIDTVRIKSNESAGFFHDNLYKTLYKSYLKTSNLKKADYYFEKHLASLKGQMNVNNSVHSNFKKNEIAQYNEEVSALRKQGSKQYLLMITVALASLFIVFFIFIRFRNKQKRHKGKLKAIMEQLAIMEQQTKPKTVPININDEEIKRVVERLNELEDKNYFLRVDCSVSNLAKKLKTNTTYLSKIINAHHQKNFTTYVNDLRIDYVLNKLKEDKIFRRYTIQSIANEIGFKSKETFNSAFRKRTGVLPSALIKELTKEFKRAKD